MSDAKVEQEVRSSLRLDYLRALSSLAGKACALKLFDGSESSGVFQGADRSVQHVCIERLETPLGVLPWALVRTQDIVAIDFKLQ
jgi:hypothetical protein